jgi:hypothetical protein
VKVPSLSVPTGENVSPLISPEASDGSELEATIAPRFVASLLTMISAADKGTAINDSTAMTNAARTTERDNKLDFTLEFI